MSDNPLYAFARAILDWTPAGWAAQAALRARGYEITPSGFQQTSTPQFPFPLSMPDFSDIVSRLRIVLVVAVVIIAVVLLTWLASRWLMIIKAVM